MFEKSHYAKFALRCRSRFKGTEILSILQQLDPLNIAKPEPFLATMSRDMDNRNTIKSSSARDGTRTVNDFFFFSYPQNDSHSVGIHQQSSNKSNRTREFPVLAMDGNSISFTQFRAFASGRAIDDSTGVPIVSRCFQRFPERRANRRARIA